MNTSRYLSALALLTVAGAAFAQQPQPAPRPAQPAPAAQQPVLTPQQQAQLAKQDAEMSQAALQVMQLVDNNRIGEVWDGASAAMKRSVAKDEFVKQVTIDRNRVGKPSTRGKPVVTRSQYPAGGRVPEGLYLNVGSPTQFANTPQPVRELVSFRLDEDKTWRVSGYSLR